VNISTPYVVNQANYVLQFVSSFSRYISKWAYLNVRRMLNVSARLFPAAFHMLSGCLICPCAFADFVTKIVYSKIVCSITTRVRNTSRRRDRACLPRKLQFVRRENWLTRSGSIGHELSALSSSSWN